MSGRVSTFKPLLVWCEFASPPAGELVMLDGLLTDRAALLRGKWRALDRNSEPPPFGECNIYVAHSIIDGEPVYHCSSPIPDEVLFDEHQHFNRRFPFAQAFRLDPSERTQVNTTGGEYKSYRLPDRLRGIKRLGWVVEGDRREIRALLKDVHFCSHDDSRGNGAVARVPNGQGGKRLAWFAEERQDLAGCWWFQPTERGQRLMRPLPFCAELPQDMIGYRRDFDAVRPPYWLRAGKREVVKPC